MPIEFHWNNGNLQESAVDQWWSMWTLTRKPMRLFRCEAPHGIVPPVITFLAEGENGRKASTLPTRTSTTTAVLQQPGGFCTAFDQTIPQKQQVKNWFGRMDTLCALAFTPTSFDGILISWDFLREDVSGAVLEFKGSFAQPFFSDEILLVQLLGTLSNNCILTPETASLCRGRIQVGTTCRSGKLSWSSTKWCDTDSEMFWYGSWHGRFQGLHEAFFCFNSQYMPIYQIYPAWAAWGQQPTWPGVSRGKRLLSLLASNALASRSWRSASDGRHGRHVYGDEMWTRCDEQPGMPASCVWQAWHSRHHGWVVWNLMGDGTRNNSYVKKSILNVLRPRRCAYYQQESQNVRAKGRVKLAKLLEEWLETAG